MLSFIGGRFDEHFVPRELFSLRIIPKVSLTENKINEMVKINTVSYKIDMNES